MGELISTQLIVERISERTWDVLTDLMVLTTFMKFVIVPWSPRSDYSINSFYLTIL